MKELRIRKMHAAARIPTRANATDAGLDLSAIERTVFEPGQTRLVRTGIAVALDAGFVGLVADRSSMAKKGFKTAGGVIDAGYRGEIQVVLMNLSQQTLVVETDDRIAQLLVVGIAMPAVVEADDLDATERGTRGFGSSGRGATE